MWGIWCLATKGWVHNGNPKKPCEYPTHKSANADLKDFTLDAKDRADYEVKRLPKES